MHLYSESWKRTSELVNNWKTRNIISYCLLPKAMEESILRWIKMKNWEMPRGSLKWWQKINLWKRWCHRNARQKCKEETTENTTNPENDLKTAKQTIYTCWRRKDHIEKDKVAKSRLIRTQTLPASQLTSLRERNRNEDEISTQKSCTPGSGDLL